MLTDVYAKQTCNKQRPWLPARQQLLALLAALIPASTFGSPDISRLLCAPDQVVLSA